MPSGNGPGLGRKQQRAEDIPATEEELQQTQEGSTDKPDQKQNEG